MLTKGRGSAACHLLLLGGAKGRTLSEPLPLKARKSLGEEVVELSELLQRLSAPGTVIWEECRAATQKCGLLYVARGIELLLEHERIDSGLNAVDPLTALPKPTGQSAPLQEHNRLCYRRATRQQSIGEFIDRW